MNESDLRRAFRALSAGELPVDFVDDIVRRLPDRPRQRGRVAIAAGLAVALAGMAVVIWTLGPRWLASEPDAFSPSLPGSDQPPPTSSAAEAAGGVILAIEITPGGATFEGSRRNEFVFKLDADGTALYHDYEFGVSRGDLRVAYLIPEQIRALIDFAIGPGGMREASERYERGSRGPSGHTIIRLDTPDLVKTVDYGLGPGNLVRDDDPTLGGLPDLVERLSQFSDDVQRGDASGGLLLTEVERAEAIALEDPRFGDLLATSASTTDRVVPAPEREGDVLVYVSIADGGEAWPSIDTCEIGGSDGPATGVVWQVDLAAGEIVAVSLRWGSADCLSG